MENNIERLERKIDLLMQRTHQKDASINKVANAFEGIKAHELNNELKKYNKKIENDQKFYRELSEVQDENLNSHKKLKQELRDLINLIPKRPNKREIIFNKDSKKNLKSILYSISITTIIVFYGFTFIEQAREKTMYQIAYEQLYLDSSEEGQIKLENRLVEAANKHNWYEKAIIYLENW